MNFQEKIQFATMIATFILIFCLILAIILFTKNIELLQQDPIMFAIEKTSIASCSCISETGQLMSFP